MSRCNVVAAAEAFVTSAPSTALQSRIPDVQAVACGAILSNYQRLRVEHVYAGLRVVLRTAHRLLVLGLLCRRCSRLGLVSLAFLWQRVRCVRALCCQ